MSYDPDDMMEEKPVPAHVREKLKQASKFNEDIVRYKEMVDHEGEFNRAERRRRTKAIVKIQKKAKKVRANHGKY